MNLVKCAVYGVIILLLDIALSNQEGGGTRSASDFINELSKLAAQSRQRFPPNYYGNYAYDENQYNQEFPLKKKPQKKPYRPNYYSQNQNQGPNSGYAPGYGFAQGYPQGYYRPPYDQRPGRPEYDKPPYDTGINKPNIYRPGYDQRPGRPGYDRPPYEQGFDRPGFGPAFDQGLNGINPSGAGGYDPGFGPEGYDPYLQGPYPQNFGPLSGFTEALGSIARYDDQHCVPRLLCEVAAGGNPSAKQRYPSYLSYLPSVTSMESLFTLLSAFTGERLSPFLVFGRAAFLGVMSQGNPSSCRYAYPECPRDPDRLVDYLNNHNGGFFRFFNGVQPQQEQLQQQGTFSFPQDTNDPQRPYSDQPNQQYQNYPYRPYPNYQGNYNHPYRYEYKSNDNQTQIRAEARIQNKPSVHSANQNELYISQSYYYPSVVTKNEHSWKFPEQLNGISNTISDTTYSKYPNYFKFPQDSDSGRRPKGLLFPGSFDDNRNQEILLFPTPLPFYDHSKTIFPDRTGTGNLKFDSDKIAYTTTPPPIYNYNYNRYNYSPGYLNHNRYYDQQYQSSKKNLVYIVRGNGDPNHPEIIQGKNGQQTNANGDQKVIPMANDRVGEPWTFPSPYQGVIYND